MVIGIERLLLHMSWANQQTIEHLQRLPDEALGAFATNKDWQVSEIVYHIASSGDHYVYRICGKWADVPGESITKPEKVSDLSLLKEQVLKIDDALFECSKLDDIKLEFNNAEGRQVRRWRSTILSQAIHHATEHRAQIASAIESKGFPVLDLDELDLWSYEMAKG